VIEVEVAYATQQRQCVIRLAVPAGCTLRAAIEQSGLLGQFPEINLEHCRVGVFGRPRTLDDVLHDGDRAEIYRPLLADPKQARRQRAKKPNP